MPFVNPNLAPVTIHVEGHSTLYRLAERAAMSVDISDEGPAQDAISTAVTSTARTLQSALDELCPHGEIAPVAPISFYALEALSTWSRADTDKEGNETGGRTYGARTHLDIRFRDFARLGAMEEMLSTTPLVSIKGVTWRLTEETEQALAVQSRKEALEDAVRRARDFAEVVGCKNVQCVEITQGDEPTAYGRAKQTAGRNGGMADAVSGALDFEPQKVMMSASVSVKFHAS
ncbi:hypothetical protein FIBSPDRAFT_855446 [Athelia psychrophila]|uniref:SIMPL domain-containing protein n=1 Tax=Athelia psychrophila TaxID=1759441 RepID=A0A166P7Y6_9AGAM|nr:hypothetical protein FIBSPDRAFT_855446 [Fibularhizoctonia sp. CBS 109695]